MNKAQKIVLWFFAISVLVLALLFIISLNPAVNEDELPKGVIFYYGETCPHCKIVEEFMTGNNVSSKMNITMKESFGNLVNADELIKVGKYCKLAGKNLGAVPLIYSEGKCYLGDVESIDFLKTKLNITSTQ